MAHMSICKFYREKCSYVTRFTVSELLTILFLLLGASAITFFAVPLFFEHPEPDWTAIFKRPPSSGRTIQDAGLTSQAQYWAQ